MGDSAWTIPRRRRPTVVRCVDHARISGFDEAGFAEHISAILPHRAVTEAHVRAWARGPTPPPGDILWAGLRLAGVDVLTVLEAVGPQTKEIGDSWPAGLGRSVEGLADLQLDDERLAAAEGLHCKPDGRSSQTFPR